MEVANSLAGVMKFSGEFRLIAARYATARGKRRDFITLQRVLSLVLLALLALVRNFCLTVIFNSM